MRSPIPYITPDEWITLRRCSIAARGLWLDLAHLMIQPEAGGGLRISPDLPDLLVRLAGIPERDLDSLLGELKACGLIEASEERLSAPRLVKAFNVRETRKRCGSLGGRPRKVA